MASWPPLQRFSPSSSRRRPRRAPSGGPDLLRHGRAADGPTQLVGQSDRQTVDAVVKYWNARGGIKGRSVVVDVLDNASNPSQAVQNVQKFIGDRKYVAIFGSGNAAAAVATGALASQAKIPFIALSPPTQLVEPATAVRVHPHGHDPPVRVQRGRVPQEPGHQEDLAHGRQRRLGREGPNQVSKLAAAYGLEIVDTTIFSPAATDFSAELTKIKNSEAQALWLWTATPAGPTIVKQFKQLQLPQQLVLTGANASPQFLEGTCGDVNGAIINSFLATVWKFLPKKNPVRMQAALLGGSSSGPSRTSTATPAARSGHTRPRSRESNGTRAGINNALETKLRGLVTPAGRIFLSKINHRPSDGLDVGREDPGCQLRPLHGAAFEKKK